MYHSKYLFAAHGSLHADIRVTHELKIPGVERVLLFPIKSNNSNATLYVGAIYLPDGLHQASDKKQLLARSMAPIELSFPEKSVSRKLSQ